MLKFFMKISQIVFKLRSGLETVTCVQTGGHKGRETPIRGGEAVYLSTDICVGVNLTIDCIKIYGKFHRSRKSLVVQWYRVFGSLTEDTALSKKYLKHLVLVQHWQTSQNA